MARTMDFSLTIVIRDVNRLSDTVTVYALLDFQFKGPVINLPAGSPCFKMTVKGGIGIQDWNGFYLGNGVYGLKYAPKETEVLTYKITSKIPGFPERSGQLVVDNIWPGKSRITDYKTGSNWYSDKSNPQLFDGIKQGAKTVLMWRNEVLLDWATRWDWLRE